MEKSAEYKKPPTVKYAEEFKLAVKRFVVLNAANLLPERENSAELTAPEVTGLLNALEHQALNELVDSLRSFAAVKFNGRNDA